MANHGSKFVSVNLNKSYGQQNHPSHYSPFSGGGGGGNGSYGRGRGGGSAVGGGMVVLSRNRGAPPKVAPKLSVPPPLNLPSLRKEHEKFDSLGPGGGPGGGAGAGSGPRPTSSGVGWTKPAALAEKNESGVEAHLVDVVDATGTGARGSGSYVPPSARYTGAGVVGSSSAARDFPPSADRAVVLRGEDFPSLQAARPASSGTSQKQKDGLNQKQKQVAGEELVRDKRDNYHLGPMVDAHPLVQSSRHATGNGSLENTGGSRGLDGRQMTGQLRKQEEYFPDPLPLVRLNPRSDWADDERDTGHGFVEQGREIGYSRSESYWDRDFDLPRPSVLPHKPAQNLFDRRGERDNEAGKKSSSEVLKIDPYPNDLRVSSRDGREVNNWRTSPFSKGGSNFQSVGSDRINAGARMVDQNNMVKDNKYVPPRHGDTARDGNAKLYRDSAFGNRDLDLAGRQNQWNHSIDQYNNRGTELNSRNRQTTEEPTRYRGDYFQDRTLSRSSLASSGKVPPVSDPILNMGRDKRSSKGDRPFSHDPFASDIGSASFDERDLFPGGFVGVIKRKKDAAKSTDFHDPVRESFEAELERVQKMQELERQRIVEEQERALEKARRDQEERQRRIIEENERQRKLEMEAQEAAWRAEQEQLEAIRKAEELKTAREEERKRLHLEEERRKQAAKQKLLELEAKMAKRQAETSKSDVAVSNSVMDENVEAVVKGKVTAGSLDLDSWEDRERMVEKVTTSAPFESSAYGGAVQTSMRPYPPREGSSVFLDKGKGISSWRRDVFETGSGFPSPMSNQEIGHYSPKSDAYGGGRAVPRNELNGGAGYMSSRSYMKEGMQEPYADEFDYHKDHRWNLSVDADSYGKLRELDSEFPDSVADTYGDNGWGRGRPNVSARSPYPERLYPNAEENELYSHARSRYSMRQPRVLPPPSLASTQRTNYSGVTERSGQSAFLDNSSRYMHTTGGESTKEVPYYGNNQEGLEASQLVGLQQETTTVEDQKLNNASRCDSQSSLSVFSPPTSPPHLSNDELDESGDSPVASAVTGGKSNSLSGSVLNDYSGKGTIMMAPDSVSAVEDEEWTLENDGTLQQPEEYDEDDDGYREEDELREGDDENIELNQKFVGLELEEIESSHMMDNVVLGFDEGVEVVMPRDDFDKTLGIHERSFGISRAVEEGGVVDGVPSKEHRLLPADDSSGASAYSSSGKIPETEFALEGSVSQPTGALTHSSATSAVLDGADSSESSGVRAQQTVSSSGEATAASGLINFPSLSSSGSSADPVQLQFGLFSGPSLIPTGVPAIQIGSIQMPLHIHPPIGSSLSHIHPSQPPMFQFGQLRYTSPISQGILSMAPQPMSFVNPNMQGHFNLNQTVDGAVPHQAVLGSSQNTTKDMQMQSIDKQPSFVSKPLEQSDGSISQGLSSSLVNDNPTSSGVSAACDKKIKSESGSQAEEKVQRDTILKSYTSPPKEMESESQLHHARRTMRPVSGEKNFGGQRGVGQFSGVRGKRFAYAVKNSNPRSSQVYDIPADSIGFQRRPRRTVRRTEFRIRDNNDSRQAHSFVSSDNTGFDDKSYYMSKSHGDFTGSGSKRGTFSNRTLKQRTERELSASENYVSRELTSGNRTAKEMPKNSSSTSSSKSLPGEAITKNVSEDVDAPLQSGFVRVFKQPGIEAPSDGDDFIEVRSKRQMLNDRREQREKEIKAKARISKPPRKPRSTKQNAVASRNHNEFSVPYGTEESRNSQSKFTSSEMTNNIVSTGFVSPVSQPLGPIGTPAVNYEAPAIKTQEPVAVSVVANGGKDREPGLAFESKSKVVDHAQSSSTNWNSPGIDQQVMSLTQTQLDEAMKPARYDAHISAVGVHSSSVGEHMLSTPSILTKDKSFSSGASPINSLLAGEKIQFGAVTSPTILPSSSRVVTHGIGAPGSNRPDVQMARTFPVSESGNSLFFEKEKHQSDSCVPLHDCEAEAEAAASAVAVAAISSDEIVDNSLGSANVSNTKNFGAADIDSITTGIVGDQRLASQSRTEELLSVSLPADLSVETTPISLWPPLPSPHSSSSQMLSHFPGGPPSHFPFYEMNPVLGGPIFAFNPHEESSGTQPQPQKSTASTSGPLGNWQPCHSGMDSFYGPRGGYPGPFISPPGGIPGVQGPPHMVVYNHFAPVGQYGQVGLSFMGTTFIPSGKQADWKHTPSTAAMHIVEGDVNNTNMNAVQRNNPNMTPSIQHLAPGSPLLPMSPLPMFDVSPFQTAPDLSVQARWGHIPTSTLNPVPVSRPLQPQVADANVSQFPGELGLVDSLRSNTASSGQNIVVQRPSESANAESGKTTTSTVENEIGNDGNNQQSGSVKTQFSHKKASPAHPSNNTSGYNYQRGGSSHRNNSRNEWSHRRMGFHGRNQSTGPPPKMKQIYVAKQQTTGDSSRN